MKEIKRLNFKTLEHNYNYDIVSLFIEIEDTEIMEYKKINSIIKIVLHENKIYPHEFEMFAEEGGKDYITEKKIYYNYNKKLSSYEEDFFDKKHDKVTYGESFYEGVYEEIGDFVFNMLNNQFNWLLDMYK